jgi:hypothetical protein
MEDLDPIAAQRIAQAVIAFQERRTGHKSKSATAVLCENRLLSTPCSWDALVQQTPGE